MSEVATGRLISLFAYQHMSGRGNLAYEWGGVIEMVYGRCGSIHVKISRYKPWLEAVMLRFAGTA